MKKLDYHIPFEVDERYHVFTRAEGSEQLFMSEENYRYFLQLLKKYILPVCDILAYALLPNHIHLLIRVKGSQCHSSNVTSLVTNQPSLDEGISKLVLQQFSNMLNAYTKSINSMYDRKGGLFMNRIRRNKVNKDNDFSNFIFYIHKNAVHHGLSNTIGEWPNDSYNTLISDKPTLLARKEILEWFGSRASFELFHQQKIYRK